MVLMGGYREGVACWHLLHHRTLDTTYGPNPGAAPCRACLPGPWPRLLHNDLASTPVPSSTREDMQCDRSMAMQPVKT